MEKHKPSLPPVSAGFAEMIASYGAEELHGLVEALDTPASVAVRFNRRKHLSMPAPAPGGGRVEWCERGVRLPVRPVFTMDPMLHQGCYYVQDPSSMYFYSLVGAVGQMARGGEPVAYLDACAAPGGKTTAAIDALPEGSAVVANEFDPRRAGALRENLSKWGYPLVTVTQGDTGRFATFGPVFDIISADVPCSGEGMMRKDADARSQWSRELVERCAALQRTIVANLWPALRAGGYLIYSTCTFNREEDEDNVRWIAETLGGECVDTSLLPPAPGVAGAIVSGVSALRFMPHRMDGEGLFVAVIRKPDSACAEAPAKPRNSRKEKSRGCKPGGAKAGVNGPDVGGWIDYPAEIRLGTSPEGVVTATFLTPLLPAELQPRLIVGRAKGRDMIPSQQLALSMALKRGAFAETEVDRKTAVSYLRRESVELPDGTPRGVVLLTYLGRPLGFVKNLGARANNLYPQEWRILTGSGADELPELPFVDETIGGKGNKE